MIWNVWSGQQPTSRGDDVLFWPIAWEIEPGEMLIRMLEENINHRMRDAKFGFENKYLFFIDTKAKTKIGTFSLDIIIFFKFDYKIHETHVPRIMDYNLLEVKKIRVCEFTKQARVRHLSLLSYTLRHFQLSERHFLVVSCMWISFFRENEK